MASLRVRAQSCRLWRRQNTWILTSQVLIETAVLVMVPSNGDGGTAKVLLKFVVEAEVADGVVDDVHLVHDSSGILSLPLQPFRRVSHFKAERMWLRGFLRIIIFLLRE